MHSIVRYVGVLLWLRCTIQNYAVFYLKRVCCQTSYKNINGVVRVYGRGDILVEQGVRLNSGVRYNPIGGDRELLLVTGPNGRIVIGQNSGLSNCTIVSYSCVDLGSDVKIGGGVKIYDTNFHILDPVARMRAELDVPEVKPVVIGDGVFVGAHSIILKGVTIGANSVIGAGSVLTKNVPENEIWAGNPAAFIRHV